MYSSKIKLLKKFTLVFKRFIWRKIYNISPFFVFDLTSNSLNIYVYNFSTAEHDFQLEYMQCIIKTSSNFLYAISEFFMKFDSNVIQRRWAECSIEWLSDERENIHVNPINENLWVRWSLYFFFQEMPIQKASNYLDHPFTI